MKRTLAFLLVALLAVATLVVTYPTVASAGSKTDPTAPTKDASSATLVVKELADGSLILICDITCLDGSTDEQTLFFADELDCACACADFCGGVCVSGSSICGTF